MNETFQNSQVLQTGFVMIRVQSLRTPNSKFHYTFCLIKPLHAILPNLHDSHKTAN